MNNLFKLAYATLVAATVSVGFTACSDDDLDTNPYNKSGVNIVAFGPSPIERLDEIRISGTNLDKVDKILFPKNVEAVFTLDSKEEITCIVPDDAVPGHIRLVAGRDTVESLTNVVFLEPIKITSVAPTTGLKAGDLITVKGEYVYNIAQVTFSEGVIVKAEDFVTNTRKEITLRVPSAAISGDVVFSDGNEDDPTDITWKEPLEILSATAASLDKESYEFGDKLVIKGYALNVVEKLTFPGSIEVTDFTVNADGTELSVTIPAETYTGSIALGQVSGLSSNTPEMKLPMAEVTSVSPSEELKAGDVVTIEGINLDRIVSVTLPGNNTLDKSEYTQSATQITFTIPEGMGDGAVTLTQHAKYSVTTPKLKMHQEGEEYTIWTGKTTIGNWDVSMSELAYGGFDWTEVKAGQILTAYLTMNEGAEYAQIRFGNGDWGALPSTSDVINIDPSDEKISITLTEEDLDQLQHNEHNGLVLCGANYTVTKVTLSILQTIAWQGTWDGSGWGGFEDLAYGRYDFSTFQLGQKILITVGFVDPTSGWACICPKMGQNWASLSAGQIDLVPSEEDQVITFTPTAEDIDHLINDGGFLLQGDGYILKKIVIR